MIRFRLGQQWKRESAAQSPRDTFGLELDGVELLAGASEEPLDQLVPALVEAASALQRGETIAEVSLREAHFELCFTRVSPTEVELAVVSLARPARQVHPPLRLELLGLLDATARCARQWAKDRADAAPPPGPTDRRPTQRQLRELERGAAGPAPEVDPGAWRWERFPRGPGQLAVVVSDADGRTLAFHRRSSAPLPPLLSPGEVRVSGTSFCQRGPPFLVLLELTRRALDDGGETTSLAKGEAVGSRAIFEAGLEWCVAMGARNPALASNPHLQALADRCAAGLSALRPLSPGLTPSAGQARAEPRAERPLPVVGALRRLAFEEKWERSTEVADHGHLRLTRRGPVVLSPHAAWAFDPKGKSLHRRVDTHGVAVGDDGTILTASSRQVAAFAPGELGATWFRDHDAVAIGPHLARAAAVWITSLGGRGLLAYDTTTGRERWRLDPPRTQRATFRVLGDRVLLAADSGSLYGLEVADGQTRFRIRATLPFHFPPVAHGRRALAVISRAERTVVFLTEVRPTRPEVAPGAVVWTIELTLARPCPPVVAAGVTYLAGHREDRAVVVAINRQGQQRWERAVPLSGRLALVAHHRGVIAADARGAAACVSADGQLEWVVGAAGDELADLPAPSARRGVLVLAGERIRAVDPRSGRVLAELGAGRGLLDVAVDGRLNVYSLDDAGLLRAWRLATTLAVV